MNSESHSHSTAGRRELGGSQPAPLLVLAWCSGSRNHKNRNNKTKTKNHLHEFLYKPTTNGQPVFQYRVTTSTNVRGWEFLLEFYLAQYRHAHLSDDSRHFGTNGWELDLTAKGKVPAIGVGTEHQI